MYVSILLPGYSTVTQVTNEITVAETVIVGRCRGPIPILRRTWTPMPSDAKDYILNKD
ncbi:MAG: hypothetical protein ACLU38_03825 [Dysosmobacter sp.]